MEEDTAFDRIARVIAAIPAGQIRSYGEVALLAGFPRGARTVVWVLKTRSDSDSLPWHRVVRKDHRIAIKNPDGHFLQGKLLEAEGWTIEPGGLLVRKDGSPQSRQGHRPDER
jgi:methylated-DNA-protein-cysteine methyltransferase-like protein